LVLWTESDAKSGKSYKLTQNLRIAIIGLLRIEGGLLKMNKRFFAFLLIAVVFLAAIVTTSPSLLKQIRLGLDLKGGFEILYEASPIEEGQEVTKDSLLETARSLEKRANANNVAEPEV